MFRRIATNNNINAFLTADQYERGNKSINGGYVCDSNKYIDLIKRRTPDKRMPCCCSRKWKVDNNQKTKRTKKKICSMNFVKENITKQGTKEKEKRPAAQEDE